MKQNHVSVIVVAYNIPRELPRTLLSLALPYQQGVTTNDYEVIVVDNGSSPAVSASLVEEYGPNFRLLCIDDASPSPAAAVNLGIMAARGDKIGVMIDGARIVTPGLVHFAGVGTVMGRAAVVAAPGWYLGSDIQGNAPRNGYTRMVEDSLLQSIRWPEDGYRLFEIGTMDESSVDPWFSPIAEANALFMSRKSWHAIGGMDERFRQPGGGLVNLDTLERAMNLPEAKLILTLGEATFHQLHGGISTNAPIEQQSKNWIRWKAERDALRGQEDLRFHIPSAFVGSLPRSLLPHLARATIASPFRVGPAVVAGFRAELKPPEGSPPTNQTAATLVSLAKVQFQSGHYQAAADILRMASTHAPAELAASRLLAFSGILARHNPVRDATYFAGIGDAYFAIGETEKATVQYRKALDLNSGAVEPVVARLQANLGEERGELSRRLVSVQSEVEENLMGGFLHQYFLNNSGKEIYKWLHYFNVYERHFERFRNRRPVVVEVGVYKGGSLEMWRAYFGEGARIVGIDIDPACKAHEAEGIEVFIGSQDDTELLDRVVGKYGPIDIVIDDGSHMMDHVVATFEHLYQHVQPNGIYLVEDTHTSYWDDYGGGLRKPGSFMEFVKRKLDEINAHHARGTLSATAFTNSTDSICVYDSIVVFEKRQQGKRQSIMTGKS
ncbi:glycosyltransferase [Mesorhizobium erdmanii]|uniref:glycosyltransferase n=1 Tax=Mesorhizobium erdmanii TaxID=1777866 RepID=UPI00040DBC11|nr:glycosyltransferase [Mesorhizobium erdmanii]